MRIFATVVSFGTVCLFLSLVCHKDLELHRMDVKTAFLYGDWEPDINM